VPNTRKTDAAAINEGATKLDARRSFRPSASLFSTRSAASKRHSTKTHPVTNHDTGLTTSRPSVTGGGEAILPAPGLT
jgi:hypothetical protein